MFRKTIQTRMLAALFVMTTFGVAVVSTDNQVFSIGEINYAFSIQSISKVYTR